MPLLANITTAITSLLICAAIGALAGSLLALVKAYARRRERAGRRPLGVTLIACVEFLVGLLLACFFVGLLVAMYTRYDELQAAMHRHATSCEEMAAKSLIDAIFAWVAGWGLWCNKPVGWEIATFAVACALAANLTALLINAVTFAGHGLATGTFNAILVRIVFEVAVLFYLHRPKILAFYSRQQDRTVHALRILHWVLVGIGLELLLSMLHGRF